MNTVVVVFTVLSVFAVYIVMLVMAVMHGSVCSNVSIFGDASSSNDDSIYGVASDASV